MKCKVVSSKEIFDKNKNPICCLSAKRYLDGCANCSVLHFYSTYYKTYWDPKTQKTITIKKKRKIDEILQIVSCKPLISEKKLKLLYKKDELLEKTNGIKEQIKKLNKKIEET